MEDLSNFFNPKIVAIIGASDHERKVGGALMRKSLLSSCRIVPVNPQHEFIFGKKCYPSISEVPWKVDLAVIAIPAPFVSEALEQCGEKRIKNVIVISAGFAETGNKEGEAQLVKIAGKYGISLLGPNCFGILSPEKKLDLTFSAATPEKGDIAFISQSGALWSYIADLSVGTKLGFSGFVSLGNMAELGFDKFISYFDKDKNTKAIVLYVEKLNDGRKFIDACKKCSKEIYVVKAGKSVRGAEAAVSHTASLATDYEIYKGAFKQAGIILCESLIEAFEKASGKKLLTGDIKKMKIGKKVFIITNAGGAGALASDDFSDNGFEIVDKPLDILGTALALDYNAALEKTKNMHCDSVVVILTGQTMSEIKETAQVIADFKKKTGKNIIALFLGGKSMLEANKIFQQNSIPYFNTLDEAKNSLSL